MPKKIIKKKPHSGYPLFPSHQKYRDNLKLLVADKKFQERIKEIREYVELPENGIDTESPNCDECSEAWHGEFSRRSDKMIEDPTFILELKKYRKIFDEKEISFREYEDLRKVLHRKIPINYFTWQCKKLTEEFNVPLNSADSIRYYIIYNKLNHFSVSPFVTSTGSSADPTENSVSLTFYVKITDEDLRSVKNTVNGFFGKNLPKINPIKDIDTKLAIEQYHRNRDVFDHIDEKNYRLTAKEIAENIKADTGNNIEADDVYEVMRELENLRNKRFRQSGKK